MVANGGPPPPSREASGETWTYEMAEPMATYLASVQIGRYQQAEHQAPRMRHGRSGQAVDLEARSFGRQTEMMAVFERLFGAYPFGAYTAVITDDDLEIPLEARACRRSARTSVPPTGPRGG